MEILVDARRTMLGAIIDYAGVFPPASLDLSRAVQEYRTHRTSAEAWVLGRFLCPTSQIEELAALLTTTMTTGEPPWSVGAVFDEPPGVAALHASVFDRHMDPAARITAVEVRTPPEAGDGREPGAAAELMRPVAQAAASIAPQTQIFLEIPRRDRWEIGLPNALAGVAELRRTQLVPFGAKLRTGGLDAGAFPSAQQVASFIVASHDHGVPFKVTAGLHHPVRHFDADLGVMRHGFLNIVVAAALAAEGAGEAEVAAAVAEDDPASFVAGPAGLRYKGRRLGAATLRTVRQELFLGYGSCSFDEPIADLHDMGVLGS